MQTMQTPIRPDQIRPEVTLFTCSSSSFRNINSGEMDLFMLSLFVPISLSFGSSGGLCFVIVVFSEYFH